MIDSVVEHGPCPAGLDSRGCFEEVLKSKDTCSLEVKNRAPYQPELLKVMKSNTVPKAAAHLLPPDQAEMLENTETHIIRS